jgi:hypothetical protein
MSLISVAKFSISVFSATNIFCVFQQCKEPLSQICQTIWKTNIEILDKLYKVRLAISWFTLSSWLGSYLSSGFLFAGLASYDLISIY